MINENRWTRRPARYVTNCESFLEGQQKKLGIDMHERHDKITIMNDIIDLGNDNAHKGFQGAGIKRSCHYGAGGRKISKKSMKSSRTSERAPV